MLWIDHHWVDFNRWIVQITLSRAVDTFVKQLSERKTLRRSLSLYVGHFNRDWDKELRKNCWDVELCSWRVEGCERSLHRLDVLRREWDLIDASCTDSKFVAFDSQQLWEFNEIASWESVKVTEQKKNHSNRIFTTLSLSFRHTNISSRVRVSFSWQREQIGSEARKLMRKMCSII